MRILFFFFLVLSNIPRLIAQPDFSFTVSNDPGTQSFVIDLQIRKLRQDTLILKMPAWTPGYYQLLHFADNVYDFTAASMKNNLLSFEKRNRNAWVIPVKGLSALHLNYRVKATRNFVATPYVDSSRAYLSPPGVFLYADGRKDLPAFVHLNLQDGWTAATGLKKVKGSGKDFYAENFDILFDSPILMGPLETLPRFTVQGIPHDFIGYRPAVSDPQRFTGDLKKIISEAVAIIQDIPYTDYTFIAIGPGQGGIEHLNSTSFGFSGQSLNTPEGKRRMYTFLAHEYFHHYNVKRIRPIELGPFDYDQENRTTLLWLSEGITVYYDQLLVRRAGLMSTEELLEGYRSRLLGYENKPGRLYQSATQASYSTWNDGPFGRSVDEVNKTVSVYDKGAILGLLLDFEIRHKTNNLKSLDDLMNKLYNEYYQQKKRGFTPAEFQDAAEQVAGGSLKEIFGYAETVAPVNYKKYFEYAGLDIDTVAKQLPGAWLGIQSRNQGDSIIIAQVEYDSPAWKAGLRRQMLIKTINNSPATQTILTPILKDKSAGEKIIMTVSDKGVVFEKTIETAVKTEADFKISLLPERDSLQQRILDGWVKSRANK
jgi:predicted metalloprotease with PDZ domain